jgi:hypothetical protein
LLPADVVEQKWNGIRQPRIRVNIGRSLEVSLSLSGSGNCQTATGLFLALPFVSGLDLSFGSDQS